MIDAATAAACAGVGRGIVVNVGDRTAMGRIASLASGLDSGLTPMAREIAEFVHLVSFIAVGTGAIIFAIAMGLGYSWLNSVIFLIGVVMSYVPEGLVATIAVQRPSPTMSAISLYVAHYILHCTVYTPLFFFMLATAKTKRGGKK